IGFLCPAEGQLPQFLQLYFYDTDNEVDNRMNHFGGENSNLRRDIVEGLIELLDTHKALVHLFITAHEKLADTHVPNFQVRLYNIVGAHEYELLTGDMLGAIVYEPGPETQMEYDIVIEERSGYPQRVNKLHSSYMSVQFLLLFLYGEDGFSKDFKLVGDTRPSKTDKRLSMKAYYVYLMHDRKNSYNYLSRIATTDCADMVDRVFEMKIQQFVKYLRNAQPFGRTVAVLYTIEFQKRGLPHCHTLLWIHDAARVHRDEDIDLYVSAELPSKHTDPECYRIVSELMIHVVHIPINMVLHTIKKGIQTPSF
ncbi:DNA helicase, partial [Tanacetum coccineum]